VFTDKLRLHSHVFV